MNAYPPAVSASAALWYPGFHTGVDCVVDLLVGPSGLVVACKTCRLVANLEAVSKKVAFDASQAPLTEVFVDPSDASPGS